MADYDDRGRDAFLEYHHFGRAKWWYVLNDGKQYDSKAIVGVAIGIHTGSPLTSNDFNGGEGSVVRKLKSLRFDMLKLPISEETSRLPAEVGPSYPEGLRIPITVNRAERSAAARLACIAAHGTACAVCEMTFEQFYGKDFTGLIHVHHLTPLAGRTEMTQVEPRKDLRPVCPNCHAALHHGGDNRSLEDIRSAMREARKRVG